MVIISIRINVNNNYVIKKYLKILGYPLNILLGYLNPYIVILLHDIRAQFVQAVPLIIQQGYKFEAYDEKEHFVANLWHDQRLSKNALCY